MKYEYTCHRVKDNLTHYFKSNDEYEIGEEVIICGEKFTITNIELL